MPVPEQRDPDRTRAALAAWLAGHLPGAEDPTVSGLRTPSLSEFSSETLMFDVEWSEAGERRRQALVARVAPTSYRLFWEARFEDHCRVMSILDAETDVPVAPVRWYEPDPAPLGAPFIVMDHVEGRVPSDQPPYHVEGWVVEAAPEARERMWWRSLEVMADIHRLDVRALDLGFVDRPEYGRTGIDQQLGYYERFLAWAMPGGLPVASAALDWLRREQPDEPEPPRLLWGDARIGNVIYRDAEPRAILDWEMVALGQPEMDLAWFLHLDRHHCEGVGVPRLAGFPGREASVARYERLLGRPLLHLAYYEVFAALRFAVIMARIACLFIEFGLLPEDSGYAAENSAAVMLRAILDATC